MTTRGHELTNPNQQFPQLLRMKFWYRALRHLVQLPEMMRSLSMFHCLRLSLEETAQAQARWPDRTMDTRWARTSKPDDSKPSGRHAKERLIIKGFTDPDLLDIESHSPTLTRVRFMTVLQSVCSHGHKVQFGDVQQALNTGDPIKRKEPLFVRMPPGGVPGGSRGVWVQLLKRGTVSLLQPEVWGSRHPSWNRVFWP